IPIVAKVLPNGQAAKWNKWAEPSRKLRPGLGLRSVDETQDAARILSVLLEMK
ncbi:unnamed protein product, partial [Effrenium voratum]